MGMTKNIDRRGWLQLAAFVIVIAAVAAGAVVAVLVWLL